MCVTDYGRPHAKHSLTSNLSTSKNLPPVNWFGEVSGRFFQNLKLLLYDFDGFGFVNFN